MPRITNTTGLPAPLVDALRNDGYSRGESDISATGLIAPARKAELEWVHAHELTEDAADLAAVLIGKAVHEKIAANAIGELSDKRRLFMRVNGWTISGQTDHVSDEMFTAVGGTIYDYKTTGVSEWRFGLKEERAQQLNIYAELLRVNGYAVTGLAAILIFKDWSAPQARFGGANYPPASIVEIEVPLWPREQAQAYILERVKAHQAAQAVCTGACDAVYAGSVARLTCQSCCGLPLCSDEERWLRGEQWAVMKTGNKISTKNFDDEAAAIALAEARGNSYHVEHRSGVFNRCEYYCAVGRQGLCSQWNAERAAVDADPFDAYTPTGTIERTRE